MPPCGRPHAGVIKYSSLSENSWYNDLPDLKPKFDYNMIVIYLKLLLVIYITTVIYIDAKFPLFTLSKTKFWHKKRKLLCMRKHVSEV